MKNQEILTYFGTVQIPTIKMDEPDAGGISHFRIETKYINNMQKVVRAKLRSNMEMTFPQVPHHTDHTWDHQFIVRQELIVSSTCIDQMRNYFFNLPENDTGALSYFRKAYLRSYDAHRVPARKVELRCAVDYVFSEQDLKNANGIFYHDELDTLFKFGAEPFDVPHPHSFTGRKLAEELVAEEMRSKHGFVFWVEIIDNHGKYGDRYLPICNQVYKISARTDKKRPCGLYIVSSKPTNGKINPDEVSTKFYPFEDIEKELGIYQSYEQALNYGDVALGRKKELAAMEHQIAIDRQAAQREKQEFERERLRYETEIEEKNRRLKDLEYERSMHTRSMDDLRAQQATLLEMERLRAKEYYDKRSNERKDTSEMIKLLPTILSGIGMVLMAWKAFKPG